MKLLKLSLILLIGLWPNISGGHWEDPLNCSAMQTQIKAIPQDNWIVSYAGVSEDNKDFIIRFTVKGSTLRLEQHHTLLPQVQWKEDIPTFLPQILSEWLDWDGDGFFSEWYLFPKGETDCKDALHFVWDEKQQTYRLYTIGKERAS